MVFLLGGLPPLGVIFWVFFGCSTVWRLCPGQRNITTLESLDPREGVWECYDLQALEGAGYQSESQEAGVADAAEMGYRMCLKQKTIQYHFSFTFQNNSFTIFCLFRKK